MASLSKEPSLSIDLIYLMILSVNGYRYEVPSLDLMAAIMTRPIFSTNRPIMISMAGKKDDRKEGKGFIVKRRTKDQKKDQDE